MPFEEVAIDELRVCRLNLVVTVTLRICCVCVCKNLDRHGGFASDFFIYDSDSQLIKEAINWGPWHMCMARFNANVYPDSP